MAAVWQQALERFQGFEGMLSQVDATAIAAVCEYQNGRGIGGSIAEFGVYKGRTAALLAHYLQPNEMLHLIDVADYLDRQQLAEITENFVFHLSDSRLFFKNYRESDRFRIIHSDGSHTYENVFLDLKVADRLLSPEGILIVDDYYNPHYPQVAVAVAGYASRRWSDLAVFLVGSNKCYLCRRSNLRAMKRFVLENFASFMDMAGCAVQLSKTDAHPRMDCYGFKRQARGTTESFYGQQLYGHFYRVQEVARLGGARQWLSPRARALVGAYLIPDIDIEASGLDRGQLGRHQIVLPSRFAGYRVAGRSVAYVKEHMPEALPLYRRSANPLRKAWRILDSRGLVPGQLRVLFGAYLIPDIDIEASGLDRGQLGRHQIVLPSRFAGYRVAGRSVAYVKEHMPEALPLYRRSANPLRKAWRILDSRGLVPGQLRVLFGAYLIPDIDIEASGLDRGQLGRHQIVLPSRFAGYRVAGRSVAYVKEHMPEALPLYRRSANPLRKAWRILDSRGLVPGQLRVLFGAYLIPDIDIEASGLDRGQLGRHQIVLPSRFAGYRVAGRSVAYVKEHMPEALPLYRRSANPLRKAWRILDSRTALRTRLAELLGRRGKSGML